MPPDAEPSPIDEEPIEPRLPEGNAWAGEASIEAERGRVAHELHDALLPLLFAARMHAQRLCQQVQTQTTSPPQLADELVALADELGQAMATGRRLLVGLHPPELTTGDWHQALRYYVDRGLELGETQVRLELHPQSATLSPPQALAAYRIAQEAIRNAIRHGQASQIIVTAAALPEGLRMTITDDGRGFDPQSVAADRFGVRGICERAARVGGRASIQSRPGAGTALQVDLPTT